MEVYLQFPLRLFCRCTYWCIEQNFVFIYRGQYCLLDERYFVLSMLAVPLALSHLLRNVCNALYGIRQRGES